MVNIIDSYGGYSTVGGGTLGESDESGFFANVRGDMVQKVREPLIIDAS